MNTGLHESPLDQLAPVQGLVMCRTLTAMRGFLAFFPASFLCDEGKTKLVCIGKRLSEFFCIFLQVFLKSVES